MKTLVGTGSLIRLILRRDRLILLIWMVALAALTVGVAAALPKTYPTFEARQAFANETTNNPTEIIMIGPVFDSSIGGITAWRTRGWGLLGLGLASLLTVIRHTRTEEESGRRELLGSTVVGRHAALSASLIVTLAANLVVAALIACGLIGLGLPPAGSIALGLSFAAAGWIFAALAGVAAQLTTSAGSARGIAGAFLALFYVLRALGDVRGAFWLVWVSPFSWAENVHPFAHESWGFFVPMLGLIIILIAVAYVLASRRDLGAGLLPSRLASATASPGLRNAPALAWRLHRGALLIWVIAFAGFGAALGGVAQSATEQLNASSQLNALIANIGNNARPVDGFFALIIYLLTQALSVYAIQTTLRLRSEEMEAHADLVLATPVSRVQWVTSHLLLALAGPAVVLGALGLAMGLVYGLSTGDVAYELPRLLLATLVRLPSIWVLVGITMALYGFWPRVAGYLSWIVLASFLVLELPVELHLANSLALIISPFIYAPRLPAAQLSIAPLVGLICVAAILTVAGLFGFQRRDVG